DLGLHQFDEYFSAFLKVNHVQTRHVSVALDTSFLFLHTVPVEADIEDSELTDQMTWELSQYFPDASASDFVTASHVIRRDPQDTPCEHLCVSIRRRDAALIETMLQRHGLTLHVLDVDHFSAETSLRTNYPDSSRRFLVLVGLKEKRLDVSLIRSGNLEEYGYRLVQTEKDIIQEFRSISREFTGINAIAAYGPSLDRDLLVEIRHNCSTLIEALNPLRHVNVSDTLRLADHLRAPAYRFASTVGVALRES
ncbi:MAG: pilus assembly protein PilM, partial [Bacteroidetes bacterium]|nr:pilus assembly protein PilM [Bacteroidota bacterium]